MGKTNNSTIEKPTISYERYIWLRNNWGVMREVAVECEISTALVSMVFNGVRRNQRILKSLLKRGMPN